MKGTSRVPETFKARAVCALDRRLDPRFSQIAFQILSRMLLAKDHGAQPPIAILEHFCLFLLRLQCHCMGRGRQQGNESRHGQYANLCTGTAKHDLTLQDRHSVAPKRCFENATHRGPSAPTLSESAPVKGTHIPHRLREITLRGLVRRREKKVSIVCGLTRRVLRTCNGMVGREHNNGVVGLAHHLCAVSRLYRR